MIGLSYADARGNIYFDEDASPLADAGIVRPPRREELIPAPPGTVPAMLPGRTPLLVRGKAGRKLALGALLPAGYTRLLLPAYRELPDAPRLPLFGYAFAAVVDDELYVAAARTDEDPDWAPRSFRDNELEAIVRMRRSSDPENRILAQLATCSLAYGCFTAQNVYLERGEAAIPLSPKCNAACVGCISEQEPEAGFPSPQTRVDYEATVDEATRIAVHHLERVPEGIVSFGQGCEGEPLLRVTTMVKTIEAIRAQRSNGTINLNTNGSLPKSLAMAIDAGLQAVRISLNSFRPEVYAAYYRPTGYTLDDVFASIRLAADRGLRVSLNVLTHPGVTDDAAEIDAMQRFLASTNVTMIQTRTLNIDPHLYFATVGRPASPQGMGVALDAIANAGVRVGNFTHTH